MKLGRGLVMVSGALATAAAWVTACTGDDPTLTPGGTDASDAPANPPPPPPPGSGDAGGDADAAVQMLKCTFQFTPHVEIATADTGSGLFDEKSLRVLSTGSDTARIVVSRTPTVDVDVYTENVNTATPGAPMKNVLGTNGGRIMDLQPMTGGYAFFVQDNLGAAVMELPNTAGLGDGGAIGTRVNVAPNGTYNGGRVTEIAPHDYFYVLSRGGSAPYDLACGRTGGAVGTSPGPNAFVTFGSEPGRDGNGLLHAFPNGTYFVLNGGFGPNPVAYNIPDSCTGVDAGVPSTTLASPNTDAGVFFFGGKRSEAAPSIFDLFLVELTPDMKFGFVEGHAATGDLAGGSNLSLTPPAFTLGPSFGPNDSPFGPVSGGAAMLDQIMVAGPGLGTGGVNLLIVGADGKVVAQQTGAQGLFVGENRTFAAIALAGDEHVGAFVSYFFAWIEASTDGGVHQTVYLNRLRCAP